MVAHQIEVYRNSDSVQVLYDTRRRLKEFPFDIVCHNQEFDPNSDYIVTISKRTLKTDYEEFFKKSLHPDNSSIIKITLNSEEESKFQTGNSKCPFSIKVSNNIHSFEAKLKRKKKDANEACSNEPDPEHAKRESLNQPKMVKNLKIEPEIKDEEMDFDYNDYDKQNFDKTQAQKSNNNKAQYKSELTDTSDITNYDKITNDQQFLSFIITDKKNDGFRTIENAKLYYNMENKIIYSNNAVRTFQKLNKKGLIVNITLRIYDKESEETKNDLSKILNNGIKLQLGKDQFNMCLFGYSNSGLKDGNFWAIEENSLKEIGFMKIVEQLGDFKSIGSVKKLCKRYSQAFSTSKETIKLRKNEYVCIKDDSTENNEYEFTDGIGMIRKSVAEEISSQNLLLDYKTYIFQIRCGGFKGVLVGMPDEIFDKYLKNCDIKNKKLIKVIFRESQKKFEVPQAEISLNVVSWTPFKQPPSALNTQILMILDGLNCENLNDKILDKHTEYLKEIEESISDPKKAYSLLFRNFEISEFTLKYSSILLACKNDMLKSLEKQHYDYFKNKIIETHLANSIVEKKIMINIEKSRYLMGIIDETGTLKENEVYVSYRDLGDDVVYLDNQSVIVCRNPCYALGEVRRVKAVYVPKLHYLVNCIAFPKSGNRPLTDQLSGGDLDGDLYFVSWDDMFSGIENKRPIKYSKGAAKNPPTDFNYEKDFRKIVIDNFINGYYNDIYTGLFHFSLLSIYNYRREDMQSEKYQKLVIKINECIDGIYEGDKPDCKQKPPRWYLTSKEVSFYYDRNSQNEQDKYEKLDELLPLISKRLENRDNSLIAQLMYSTMKVFKSLVEKKSDETGEFLNKVEIKILSDRNKILKIDFENLTEDKEIFEKIRKEYVEYIKDTINLEPITNKKKNNDFDGILERTLKGDMKLKIEEKKANLTKNLRSKIKGLLLKDVLSNYKKDNLARQSLENESGIYFQTRIIQMYLYFRYSKDKDKKNCDLPWIFYDILCLLKNYVNYANNDAYSKIVALDVPYTLPLEYIKAFSANKLKELN